MHRPLLSVILTAVLIQRGIIIRDACPAIQQIRNQMNGPRHYRLPMTVWRIFMRSLINRALNMEKNFACKLITYAGAGIACP
jgi:hypothetical protein